MKNIILLSGILVVSSCLFKSENQNKNTMSEDINLLSKMINLNPLPESVQWEEFQKGDNEFGPADYDLFVVLDYSNLSDEKFLALLSNVESFEEDSNSISIKKISRNWMSKELKTKIANCKNWECKYYKANKYYNNSYLNGFFISLKSEKKILLYLFTT